MTDRQWRRRAWETGTGWWRWRVGVEMTGGRMRKTEQRDWGDLIVLKAMMNLKDPAWGDP